MHHPPVDLGLPEGAWFDYPGATLSFLTENYSSESKITV
jgi:hypothetical protein